MSGKVYTEDEVANLSDEELMGLDNIQVELPTTAQVEEEEVPDGTGTDPTPAAEEPAVAAVVVDAPEDGADPAGDAGEEESAAADSSPTAPATEVKPKSVTKAEAAPADKATQPAEVEKPKVQTEAELKAFYDKIMAPIKANGKEIQLQNADEVVRLAQMGANYTKKLQALQPNLKLLKMLENNGLLDEGKLTYLIDLDKKNPTAIQKFIKESGVDPLEIDTAAEPAYKPGNHRVSDTEMAFQTTLDELMLEPEGQKTVVVVNKTWDAQSKEMLYREPGVLQAIHEQRQNGIYDKVSAEIDRRKMLGQIPSTQSFLHAYHAVGKEMDAQGLLVPNAAAATQPSRVVDTRPAVRPKTLANDDKAKAASPTAAAAKKVVQDFNPLAMSDEDFEKNAALAARL